MAVEVTKSTSKKPNKEDAESNPPADELVELAFRGPRLDLLSSGEGFHSPSSSPIEIAAPPPAVSLLHPNNNDKNMQTQMQTQMQQHQQQRNEKCQNVGTPQPKLQYPQPPPLENQMRTLFPPQLQQLDAIHQNSMKGSAFAPFHPNSEQALKAHMNQMQMKMCMEVQNSTAEHLRRLSLPLPGVEAQLSIMNMMHQGSNNMNNRFQFSSSAPPNALNYGQAVLPSPSPRSFSVGNRGMGMPPIHNQFGSFHVNSEKSARDSISCMHGEGAMAPNHNSIPILPQTDSSALYQQQLLLKKQLSKIKNSGESAAVGSVNQQGIEYTNGLLMHGESAPASNDDIDMQISLLQSNRTSMLKQLYQQRAKKRRNISTNNVNKDVDSATPNAGNSDDCSQASFKPNKRPKKSRKNGKVNENVAIAESGSQCKTEQEQSKQQKEQSKNESSAVVLGMDETKSSLLLNSVETKHEMSTDDPKVPLNKNVGDKLENWRCQECEALCLDATAKQCKQCQAWRPELSTGSMKTDTDDDKSADWKCVKCNTICSAERKRCPGCLGWRPGLLKKSKSASKTTKDAGKGRAAKKTRSKSGAGEDAECSEFRGRTKSTRGNSNPGRDATSTSKQPRGRIRAKRKVTPKYDAPIIDLVSVEDNRQIEGTETMKSQDKAQTNSGMSEEVQMQLNLAMASGQMSNEVDLLEPISLNKSTIDSWRSREDTPMRKIVLARIMRILLDRNVGDKLPEGLAQTVKQIEDRIYRLSNTQEEYLDSALLRGRVNHIVAGIQTKNLPTLPIKSDEIIEIGSDGSNSGNLSHSCSFTASDPDMDYQPELGVDLDDVFSEKESRSPHGRRFSRGVESTMYLGEPQDNHDHLKYAPMKTGEVTHCNEFKPDTDRNAEMKLYDAVVKVAASSNIKVNPRKKNRKKKNANKTAEMKGDNDAVQVAASSDKTDPLRKIINKNKKNEKDTNLIVQPKQSRLKKAKLHEQLEYASTEPGCPRQNTIPDNQLKSASQSGRPSHSDNENTTCLREPTDEKCNDAPPTHCEIVSANHQLATEDLKAKRIDVTKLDLTANEKCLSSLPNIDPADGLAKIANDANYDATSSLKKDTASTKSIELSQPLLEVSAMTIDQMIPDASDRCVPEPVDSTTKVSVENEHVIHHTALHENTQEEVDGDKFTASKIDNKDIEVTISTNIEAPLKKKKKKDTNLVISSKVSSLKGEPKNAQPEPISSKQETAAVNQPNLINNHYVITEEKDNIDIEIIASSETKPSSKQKNVADTKLVSQDMPAPSELCQVINKPAKHIKYPNAPMGSIWLNPSLHDSRSLNNTIDPSAGGTLIGRRWVWDEGYFIDAQFNTKSNPKIFPLPKCTCGSNHTTPSQLQMQRKNTNSSDPSGRGARRSERSSTSTRMTSVLNELASGTLSPHTLIQCEEYAHGPEHRFSNFHIAEDVQPFSVRVSPDATFLADLHAHMCESEIIGFLSGWFSSEERCLYIQAAFPCKSTDRIDSGQTDVEMDPVSQIYAREAIDSHGMSVVGWYHSHPTFQPDPSVTDIENQASYQQLFASSSNLAGLVVPFVGLIIGTYDGRNPTSQSVMRWFHVRNQMTATYKNVHYPMNLKTTDRQFRKICDSECNPKQARQEMTTNGVDIRQAQETRYLSCVLTQSSSKRSFDEPINVADVNDTAMNVEVISNKSEITRENKFEESSSQEEEIVDTAMNAEVISNKSEIIRENKFEESSSQEEEIVEMTEGDVKTKKVSTVLLSQTILKQDTKVEPIKWRFPKAQPLYFTEIEKSMMETPVMNVNDSCDVIGGIIWHAVEREQRGSKSSAIKSSLSLLPSEPLSSGAIFELILRQSLTSFCGLDKKLYDIIHCAEEIASSDLSSDAVFQDSDAVIVHNVDTIISHYSTNPKKLSPFATWSGAGDKGNVIKSNGPTLVDDSNNKELLDFYLTKILELRRVELNGAVTYDGGAKKMRRGHKMAACLLKWASAMQLSPNYEPKAYEHNGDTLAIFNHETKVRKQQQVSRSENMHYYFVAEVIRLIAAKWRECSGKSYMSTPVKGRDRRSTSKIAEKVESNDTT